MSEEELLRFFLGRYTHPNIPPLGLVPRLKELGAKIIVEPSLSTPSDVIGVCPESKESQIVDQLRGTKASVFTGRRPSWIGLDTIKDPTKTDDLVRKVQRNLYQSRIS